MGRPVKSKSVAEHLVVLSRLLRSLEVDPALSPALKSRCQRLLRQLISELGQSEEPASAES